MRTAMTTRGTEYDTFGDGPDTIVLIMGLGVQRLSWHRSFCDQLVDAGFRVVRLDNRDVGGSRREARPPPSLPQILGAWLLRRKLRPPYTLYDLADDALAVLDDLGVASAHVVGVSMGGMIAQILAAKHPERSRTLTSLMSGTGRRAVSKPSLKGVSILLRRPKPGQDAFEAHLVRLARDLCNGAEGFDEAYIREIAQAAWPGRPTPDGVRRHLTASIAAGDRTRACGTIRCPTLVIHGTHDPLFSVAAAHQLTEAIPGARLELMDDLGHAFMPRHWPRIADLIVDHIRRASP